MAEWIGILQLPAGLINNQSYGYASQNPVMRIDPWGLLDICVGTYCTTIPGTEDIPGTITGGGSNLPPLDPTLPGADAGAPEGPGISITIECPIDLF